MCRQGCLICCQLACLHKASQKRFIMSFLANVSGRGTVRNAANFSFVPPRSNMPDVPFNEGIETAYEIY